MDRKLKINLRVTFDPKKFFLEIFKKIKKPLLFIGILGSIEEDGIDGPIILEFTFLVGLLELVLH